MTTTTGPTLIQNLIPLTTASRMSWSRGRRPWTPGYRAKARVHGDTGKLCGLNGYHPNDVAHVEKFRGTGTAAAATGKTYTTLALTSLPQTADITDAADYLNAILMAYPTVDARSDAIVFERLGKSVSLTGITRPYWQILTATTFKVGYAYAAGPLYSDVPADWILELIVPTLTDITTLIAGATADGTEAVVSVKDFMAAGIVGTDDGVVTLDRIFV